MRETRLRTLESDQRDCTSLTLCVQQLTTGDFCALRSGRARGKRARLRRKTISAQCTGTQQDQVKWFVKTRTHAFSNLVRRHLEFGHNILPCALRRGWTDEHVRVLTISSAIDSVHRQPDALALWQMASHGPPSTSNPFDTVPTKATAPPTHLR